jgi:hypothetical protein
MSTSVRVPVGVEEHELAVGRLGGARDLLREELARPPTFLRRDDRRELAPAHVTELAPRRVVDPADDPGRVDHVARHADVLEGNLDVAADRTQRHVSSVQARPQQVNRSQARACSASVQGSQLLR